MRTKPNEIAAEVYERKDLSGAELILLKAIRGGIQRTGITIYFPDSRMARDIAKFINE